METEDNSKMTVDTANPNAHTIMEDLLLIQKEIIHYVQ